MHATTIHFVGVNDVALCLCGAELRELETFEIDEKPLYVSESHLYVWGQEAQSVEQEMKGIVFSTQTTAVPISMRTRTVRASADCWACEDRATFEFEFDGNRIVRMENIRG